MATAEAFLESHSAQIAFVTIDIGANDVDSCVPGGTVDLACVEQGFANVKSQLPQILTGLRQADPGVQVFGMNYYDPFLAAWLLGSAGQQTARLSLTLSDTFNNDLDQIYGAYSFPTADAADAFATDDLAPTGTYAGQVLPQDVANICNWTLMCAKVTIHANDTGHAKLAAAFEQQIDGWYAGGGPGAVLASKGGGVYALGSSLFYGALNSYPFVAPVAGIAALPSRGGYWLVAADGGMFTFGSAPFYGSMGGKPLNAPIVGMAAAPTGHGYWLAAADGGIFTFGTALFPGSMTTQVLASPVVGVTGT